MPNKVVLKQNKVAFIGNKVVLKPNKVAFNKWLIILSGIAFMPSKAVFKRN